MATCAQVYSELHPAGSETLVIVITSLGQQQ